MPKQPNNWPEAALPRRMTGAWAAFYCGVSYQTFRERVKAGEYPKPDHDGRFDRKVLDKVLDRISGLEYGNAHTEDDWSVVKPPPRNRPVGRHPA